MSISSNPTVEVVANNGKNNSTFAPSAPEPHVVLMATELPGLSAAASGFGTHHLGGGSPLTGSGGTTTTELVACVDHPLATNPLNSILSASAQDDESHHTDSSHTSSLSLPADVIEEIVGHHHQYTTGLRATTTKDHPLATNAEEDHQFTSSCPPSLNNNHLEIESDNDSFAGGQEGLLLPHPPSDTNRRHHHGDGGVDAHDGNKEEVAYSPKAFINTNLSNNSISSASGPPPPVVVVAVGGGHTSQQQQQQQLPADLDPSHLRNLYVANLPTSVDSSKLRSLFEPFGVVNDVKLLLDIATGTSRGIGFIMFDKPEDAREAISKVHRHSIDGRLLQVRFAEKFADKKHEKLTGNVVYIRNIPATSGKEAIRGYFAQYGDILEVDHHPQSAELHGPSPYNMTFVVFKTNSSAATAVEAVDGKAAFPLPQANHPFIVAKVIQDIVAEKRKSVILRPRYQHGPGGLDNNQQQHNNTNSSTASPSSARMTPLGGPAPLPSFGMHQSPMVLNLDNSVRQAGGGGTHGHNSHSHSHSTHSNGAGLESSLGSSCYLSPMNPNLANSGSGGGGGGSTMFPLNVGNNSMTLGAGTPLGASGGISPSPVHMMTHAQLPPPLVPGTTTPNSGGGGLLALQPPPSMVGGFTAHMQQQPQYFQRPDGSVVQVQQQPQQQPPMMMSGGTTPLMQQQPQQRLTRTRSQPQLQTMSLQQQQQQQQPSQSGVISPSQPPVLGPQGAPLTPQHQMLQPQPLMMMMQPQAQQQVMMVPQQHQQPNAMGGQMTHVIHPPSPHQAVHQPQAMAAPLQYQQHGGLYHMPAGSGGVGGAGGQQAPAMMQPQAQQQQNNLALQSQQQVYPGPMR